MGDDLDWTRKEWRERSIWSHFMVHMVPLHGRVNGAASPRPINGVQTVDRPMMGL